MKMFKGLLCLLLTGPGLFAGAGELKVTSFTPDKEELIFRTADSGTVHHHYRVEAATSLVSGAWSVQRTVGGIGSAASATNQVMTNAVSMFFRVVAMSNSATFVDGPYMSVDVSGGTNAASYPVAYYSKQSDVPGGASSDIYKTTKILLRLIPKGTFTMGSPTSEFGRDSDETQHTVTLSRDFYMGVFEVTQRQWELVMGNKPSYFNNASYYASRPAEQVSYYDIRENPANSDDPAVDWPNNSAVNAASFMGKLRAKTGLLTLDLPTDSQWEYACRSGTTTALNAGYNLTSISSDARMDAAGRYRYNGGYINGSSTPSKGCATGNGTAKEGSYLPNAWGLYDMHGNVSEWCLDWYPEYEGMLRVLRGGCWYDNADYCRSAFRAMHGFPNLRYDAFGFRVAMTLL